MAEICDIAEVIADLGLGSSVSDADRAVLFRSKQRIENSVRRICGWCIAQATFTDYLPNLPVYGQEDRESIDIQGGKVTTWTPAPYGDVLQLPQAYVRAVLDVREDLDAYGGQGASVFTSDSLLTAGMDYWVDFDRQGLSRAGQIVRIGRSWSGVPRTIRVVYTCGLTADELDGDYSDIKDVVIEETITRYKSIKSRQGTDTGGLYPIKGESLGGEYSVQYDTSDRYAVTGGGLTQGALVKLEPFIRLPL